MKQGHYLTIEKAFRNYKRNKAALKNYPYPYTSGIDYTKPKVQGDGYTNVAEQMMMSVIEKKEELEMFVRFVDGILQGFKFEGHGRDRYVEYRYILRFSQYHAATKYGIDVRTARRWDREIFEKAEEYGKDIGIFK